MSKETEKLRDGSEIRSLRDAVVEAARETSEVMRSIAMRILPADFNAALERQDKAVRALDAAERPRFGRVPTEDGRWRLVKIGPPTGTNNWPELSLEEANIACHHLNEHFAKERP